MCKHLLLQCNVLLVRHIRYAYNLYISNEAYDVELMQEVILHT